ncbi:MAG: energy transducer TonB, partial [bacterium]|nr:energy transducer TonB [bacterium]
GGVGVPGGREDGVLGGIIREAMRPPPPPPPKAPEPKPVPVEIVDVRIGGEVQPPALLRSVAPVYPPIARQARVSGAVKIEAVIGVNGRLTSARVVSGHPLLIQAALDAVRRWVYRPTLLNSQPVKVRMQVTVNFRLSR